jgi:hypothetical protein
VMEYAEGGALSSKIDYNKIHGQKFDTDDILTWMA